MKGVQFIQVRHDAWCRAQHTQRAGDCICNADVVVVDQATWVAGVNRAQRRKAEREAKRRAKR